MVLTCDISFENNTEGCYFAGQTLTGKITLTTDKIKRAKAVVLKIRGFAHTSWTEGTSNRRRRYYGHIDYIKTLTQLLSPTVPDDVVTFEPGVHCFNFACHIPANCPSSFEGLRGHIRYLLKVEVLRPWKMDETFARGLTVLKVMNLNYCSPVMKVPVKNQMSKVFCCGPFKSDPLQLDVQMPRTGFVPGEMMPVTILVANDTKAVINEIRLRLVMLINLYSQSPRLHGAQDKLTVSKLIGDPVPMLCKKQFNYLLPVPATPPTCFDLCDIIKISYQVEVEAKIKGMFYVNQELHIPVTIGNVPLMDVIQEQPMAVSERMDSAEPADVNVAHTSRNVANENISLPKFMEAPVKADSNLMEDDADLSYGKDKFSPKYPVYDIPSTPVEQNPNSSSVSVVTDANKSTWL